ncbi:MAG: O-antigen ligase family protein [Blastochloris sp.]|nr:O-antigen ligase family protein [Blastochloris sp.]
MESSSPKPSALSYTVNRTDQVLSWLVLLSVASLLSVSILHWGGVIPSMAVLLYLPASILWICLGFKASQSLRHRQPLGSWIDLMVLLFLAYATFAFSTSPARYVAQFEYLWILSYAGVFLSLRLVLHQRRWALALLILLLLLASITCVFALMNKGVDQHLIWGQARPDYGKRISGTFGCPNHFANLMVMASCIALALSLYPRISWIWRILAFYLVAMFAVGLFFSVSRGGYLAWLTGLFTVTCFFILQRQFTIQRRLILMMLSIALALAACWVALQNPFVKSRIDATWRGDVRLQLAADAIKIWKENPLLGSGMATFDYAHQRLPDTIISSRAVFTHNDYLNLLSDYGMVGFLLVLGFFLLVIPVLLKRYADSEREYDLLVSRAAFWTLTIMAVHSIVDFNFHIPACALTFFTILAIGSSPSQRASDPTQSPFLPPALLLALGLLASGFLLHSSWTLHEATRIAAWKEADASRLSTEDLQKLGERIWQKNPNATPALEKIGDAFRVRTSELNSAFKQALSRNDTETAQQLLREREAMGQSALLFYQRSADSNPIYDSILIKQGLILDILDRDQEAFLAYNQAVQNQPRNPFFHYHLGFHLLKIGEYDLARERLILASRLPVHSPNRVPEQRIAAQKALKLLQDLQKHNLNLPQLFHN